MIVLSFRVFVPARFDLQSRHFFGRFVKPLEWKNCCSPAVNTNSFLQSPHITATSTKFMTRPRTHICFEKLTIVWTYTLLPVNEWQDQISRRNK